MRRQQRHPLVGFFRYSILAPYLQERDKYSVVTDNFEGRLELQPEYAASLTRQTLQEEGISVRFGYRSLPSGELAVAVFLPDVVDKSSGHLDRWRGFALDETEFSEDEDPRFEKWFQRHIDGSWDIENGPRQQLEAVISRINAQATESIGIPLFKIGSAAAIAFPAAQNDHRYQDAHRNLYGYLIDGLELSSIKLLGARVGRTVDPKAVRTVRALRSVKILPDTADLWAFLEHVSDTRGKAAHGSRPPARHFDAFERFEIDLERAVTALQELSDALERELGMSASTALQRHDARAWFPKIARPSEPHFSICCIKSAVGKTIVRVEYGFGDRPGCHESEVIILHFSDGSSLGIETGSNALNLCNEQNGLQASDFHADFILQWIPSAS